MSFYQDQTGKTIELHAVPKRIVSLVPSQSEFLWELGLKNELVGITKFCIHPGEMFRSVERIGGTKTLDLEKIRALQPDLVIGNKEENEKAQIETLQQEFPVWMSDIFTFDDTFGMMQQVGEMTGKKAAAEAIVGKLERSLASIKNRFNGQRVAYFIWNKPYMCAAQHTFIHHVLTHLGLGNAFEAYQRYPEVSEELLREIAPDICFLSSEPFPFKEKHVETLQQILPQTKIRIVDGEVFSWYGTRLLGLEEYVKKLLSDRSDFGSLSHPDN